MYRMEFRSFWEQTADRLLCYKIGWGNESHARLVVRQLLDRAQRMGDSNVQNLITAVSSQGTKDTDCCLVQRIVFGENHVGDNYSYVTYVRLWRWPEVFEEELKRSKTCEKQFGWNENLLCMNPYHYDRIRVASMIGAPQSENATRAEVVSCDILTESLAKTLPIKTSKQSISSHETVSPVGTRDLETSATNVRNMTLNQTLPKDIFSLSCFQSPNLAPPSLTASTILGASPVNNSTSAITSVSRTSSSQNQANGSNVEEILDADTKSKSKSDISQESTVPDTVGESSSSNQEYVSSRKTSSSWSSDDGFEMVDFDEEMNEVISGAKSAKVKLSAVNCSTNFDQVAKSKLICGANVTKTESDMTSLSNVINVAENTLKGTDLYGDHEYELPSSADLDHFIDEFSLVDEISMPQSFNVKPCQNVQLMVIANMETGNEDFKETNNKTAKEIPAIDPAPLPPSLSHSEQVEKMTKKYDELHDKYERLKNAFIEACYAATYDTLAERTEKIQDVMMNLDDIFRDTLGIVKEYTSLKMFIVKTRINDNDSGPSNNCNSTASTSTSPTCTPYRRKNLTTAMRRKNNPISSPLKLRPGAVISGIYNVSRTRAVEHLVEERSIFCSQSPDTDDGDFMANDREDYSLQWEQVEPGFVPRIELKLKHLSSEKPSCVVIDSKSNNSSGDIPCEQDKIEVKDELYELRTQIKSLKAQLEKQKQDEIDKMMHYTNNMREQHIKTVNRLTKEKKALFEELAVKKAQLEAMIDVSCTLDEKDKEIEALNGNLLALSAVLTTNDAEILALKNEKRNLKRNSNVEEPAQEISSKRRPGGEGETELNKDPITPQHVFDYLCAELEKSNLEKSQEASPQVETTNKEDLSPNNTQIKEDKQPSLGLSQTVAEKEQAMIVKLNEMVAELEVMKITHVKTKSDLEARLESGAKQYAKLYVKYDKLVKSSQLQN